ncbi:MAG: flippase, partial [Candidatus Hodarchaeota archaeon]
MKLSGFITFPIIARSIGVSVLGILGTAQAFSGMLFLIADLGLNKSLIKEVSQNKKDTDVIFSNAIMLKAASMLMALLIGLFLIKFSDLDEVSTKLGILVLLLGFIGGFDELIKSMFSGHEKMEFLPILDGLSKVSTLIAVILIFLILKGSIIELQICSIFITVGIIVLSLKFFMTKVHKIKFNLRVGMLANLLKASIPFMMVGFFAHSFGFIDSLMLASMLGSDAVGLYQIAYKLVVYLQLIPATVSTALFPTLSRLYVEDYSKFEYGLKRVFKYLFLLSIPTAISLNLMGPVLIRTIFGLEFEGSVILFQLLTWSLILNFITFPLGVSLGVSGNQKLNVIILVCGSISNIVSNYLFIGFWGINGVAISTVLSAGIVFLCSIYF